MAKHTIKIIQILRRTAFELAHRSDYQWGHMGSCNCGFLAQQVTHLKKSEIHGYAMQGHGDWSEQLKDYCPTSGLPMDNVITELINFGFDTRDLMHLERLTDSQVLNVIASGERHLKHNVKADVVRYFSAWADVLEARFIENVRLPLLELVPAEG
jgi:hypothetical protein